MPAEPRTAAGRDVPYDALVLATGSAPFVPPVDGRDLPGVFVYRTIDDLDALRAARGTAPRTGTAIARGGGVRYSLKCFRHRSRGTAWAVSNERCVNDTCAFV